MFFITIGIYALSYCIFRYGLELSAKVSILGLVGIDICAMLILGAIVLYDEIAYHRKK
jgi:hypothetical protein